MTRAISSADRGIIAGHAVHSRHPGHHSCGYPFLDGVLGEGIVNHGTFPIAMATPLDLLKLYGTVAHVMDDQRGALSPPGISPRWSEIDSVTVNTTASHSPV